MRLLRAWLNPWVGEVGAGWDAIQACAGVHAGFVFRAVPFHDAALCRAVLCFAILLSRFCGGWIGGLV